MRIQRPPKRSKSNVRTVLLTVGVLLVVAASLAVWITNPASDEAGSTESSPSLGSPGISAKSAPVAPPPGASGPLPVAPRPASVGASSLTASAIQGATPSPASADQPDPAPALRVNLVPPAITVTQEDESAAIPLVDQPPEENFGNYTPTPRIGDDGNLRFRFTPDDNAGIYQILIRTEKGELSLPFWVEPTETPTQS